MPRIRRSIVPDVLSVAVVLTLVIAGVTSRPADRARAVPRAHHQGSPTEADLSETEAIQAAMDWFYAPRVLPGTRIPAMARLSALHQAQAIGRTVPRATTAAWTNLGPQPVDSADPTYNDPSNGSVYPNGFHDVSGRVTALAVSRANANVVYLGAADGGVWKTTDGGATWTPIGDQLDSLSIGAIAISPKSPQTVWVGTGEANTNGDSYYGTGIYRSTNGGASFAKVGGTTFDRATVFRIALAGRNKALAATNHGLYRTANSGATWTQVLAPGGTTDLYGNFVSDVVYLPRTKNKQAVAAIGWRGSPGGGSDPNNGLYVSADGGVTWNKVSPAGFAPQADLGRISLGVTPSQPGLMYAVVQDAQLLNTPGANTVLNGVYKTTAGPNGPWQLVATSQVFASDPNSALSPAKIGPTYQPGIQAWYNQYVAVDPTNPNDVIVGLEEIYDSSDGGQTWHTIGRYWNVCLTDPGPPGCFQDPNLHPTTHPDQHAAAFGVVNGQPKLYVGSDGGAWSQVGPAWSNDAWTDLNATLSITQPYYAEASQAPNPTIYAGTQDNGSLKYTGASRWPEIFGGDGGDVGVVPTNPNDTYEEYVYLQMSSSTNGGQSWTNGIAPSDSGSSSTARFIAPFDLDPLDPNHLVAVGQHVWESHAGIGTTSSSWTSSFDNGSAHLGTALGVRGSTIYEGWCGPCNPNTIDSDTPFARGLATNQGGTWHTLSATGLPNRYVTSITIDPSDDSHIFVTVSAFSRRWIPRAGEGHVFESTDGGATFTDISANLPDAPANDSVLSAGTLIVATDVGVFQRGQDGTWSDVGTGLPNASALDLSMVPGTTTLIATTHGRGIWTIPLA